MALLLLVSVGVAVRYLPQLYYDVTNRKRGVLVRKKSPARAWHISCLYVCILASFLSRYSHYPDSWIVIACGTSIFGIGVAVGLMGLFTLNKQYNEGLVRHEGAALVTHGIYGIVRHPVRVGIFCELLGITILAGMPVLAAPLAAVLVLQYIRTRDEETMLRKFFGEAEEKYISMVPRFNLVLGILRVCRGAKSGGSAS
jgi:protein-S-isoprenylcysteine O-methyltransferase Ste14